MPMGQTNSRELQTKCFVVRMSGNTSDENLWGFFEVTLCKRQTPGRCA